MVFSNIYTAIVMGIIIFIWLVEIFAFIKNWTQMPDGIDKTIVIAAGIIGNMFVFYVIATTFYRTFLLYWNEFSIHINKYF